MKNAIRAHSSGARSALPHRRDGVVLAIGLALFVAIASHARADDGLTGAVAAAYFPRTLDAGLHSIAHERVVEITACATCLNHSLMRAGTFEVIGFNYGAADPTAQAIAGWRSSPIHNGILSDRNLGRIGCAQRLVAVTSYFVCVLGPGSVPQAAGSQPGSQPVAGAVLPNTASRAGSSP